MKYYSSNQALTMIQGEQNKCKGRGYSIFEDLLYLLDQIIIDYELDLTPEIFTGKIGKEDLSALTNSFKDNQDENCDEFCFEEKEVRFAFCQIKDRPKNLIEFVEIEEAEYKKLLKDYLSIKEDDTTVTIFVDMDGIKKLDD